MTVITRFAPSPTGYLHIGGARTALFNWLYARHTGGRFLLRIEDTDRKRSTDAAKAAILDGLAWLGLDWDDPPVYQSARVDRHVAAVEALRESGHAYPCYCTPEELEAMRTAARAEGRAALYDGRWRDRDPADAPPGEAPAIRFRAPKEGETVIEDAVQGTVRVANAQLDDMVLLRADGTPTYMLSVVVDDHDMGITHIIRGDDHLTNAFRQTQLFKAFGWALPTFAHIPLIHGADGAKLSKRHGALGVEAYRDMGILPAALRNYLLRLGWSHGDDEIISTEQAIAWFGLDGIGRSPARLDLKKLESVNAHYIKEAPNDTLLPPVFSVLEQSQGALTDVARARIAAGIDGLKPRAKTMLELAEAAAIYCAERPLDYTDKADRLLDPVARALLGDLKEELGTLGDWSAEGIEGAVRGFADSREIKLGKVAQPLRAALTGTTVSPGIFDVLAVLGKDESLARLGDIAA